MTALFDLPAPSAVICVAMDEEAAGFDEFVAGNRQELSIGRARLTRVSIAGRDVWLVRTGIGYVNAAAALSSVLTVVTSSGGIEASASSHHEAAHTTTSEEAPARHATTSADLVAPRPADALQGLAVISAGTAGGLHAEVAVGTVIAGTSFIHSAADARAFGYDLGQVPGMPATYRPDERLVNLIQQVDTHSPVRTGLMLSSDIFVTAERVDPLRSQWPAALSVDMETAALAQTAWNFGARFASVRAISDLCGPSEFNDHVDDAAARSAAVVANLISHL